MWGSEGRWGRLGREEGEETTIFMQIIIITNENDIKRRMLQPQTG